MTKRFHTRAFTLIELLVVIAIIAILAAILFPVFAQARESARTSSCASNQKQVSLSIIQYVQDFDEKFPFANVRMSTTDPLYHTVDAPWGKWQRENIGWDHIVQPYAKNTQVFKCVSASDGPASQNANTNDSDRTGAVQYAINRRVAGYEQNAQYAAKLSKLSFSASTILLVESTASGSTGGVIDERGGWGYADGHSRQLNGNNNVGANGDWNDDVSVPANNAMLDKLCHTGDKKDATTGDGAPAGLRRHKDGANYAFADGHVKWYIGDSTCVVWDSSKNRSGSSITYFTN